MRQPGAASGASFLESRRRAAVPLRRLCAESRSAQHGALAQVVLQVQNVRERRASCAASAHPPCRRASCAASAHPPRRGRPCEGRDCQARLEAIGLPRALLHRAAPPPATLQVSTKPVQRSTPAKPPTTAARQQHSMQRRQQELRVSTVLVHSAFGKRMTHMPPWCLRNHVRAIAESLGLIKRYFKQANQILNKQNRGTARVARVCMV